LASFLVWAITACGATASVEGPKRLLIGSAVNETALAGDAAYRATLAANFSIVTPENEMKWDTIHPGPTTYDFAPADAIVGFARAHGMEVRGHTLVWHDQNPSWLTAGRFTRDQLIAVLHDHITAVVGHYRGAIAQWDVVNEALDASGHFGHDLWLRGIGPSYIDLAFRFAHAADPSAKLFYNESDAEGSGAKSDAVYRLVAGLKRRGVPIDGVGLQSHFVGLLVPTRAQVEANMARLGALGLQVAVTEMDVALVLPAGPGMLRNQARVYSTMLSACQVGPNCHTFVVWEFTDRYSWIPAAMPGFGAADLFDASERPKPAYFALLRDLDTHARTLRRGSR
jgi:endo-1,4-beta-xylanase